MWRDITYFIDARTTLLSWSSSAHISLAHLNGEERVFDTELGLLITKRGWEKNERESGGLPSIRGSCNI